MSYKSVFPETNSPNGYSDNDLLTFIIPIDSNQELVKSSIYVSGTLKVTKTAGAPLDVADNIQYDGQTGIHSFFRSTVCNVTKDMQSDMIVENNQLYSRYAKMFYETNQHYITQCLQNSSTMELRCGQDVYTKFILPGQRNSDDTANTGENTFSFMPLVCLNRTSKNIKGYQVQYLKISFTLDSVDNIFYNPNAIANLSYKMTDLRCHYLTDSLSKETKENSNVDFIKIITTKTSIQSSEINFSYSPPGNVIAVSSSFLKQNNPKKLSTDALPDVSRLEFLVSGKDLTLQFPIKSEEELISNYILSMNSKFKESNAIYSSLLGTGYGIGLNYLNPIDFKNSRMAINIQSGVNSLYSMFIFYTCVDRL